MGAVNVRRYSLARPHPRHVPSLGRHRLGRTNRTGVERTLWGTTLRCSCGWKANGHGRAVNAPPSGGGRTEALRQYREHLATEAPQVALTRAQLDVLARVHDVDQVVRTTAHTGADAVAGNVAAVLVRHGLLRNVFAGQWGTTETPRFMGVSATAAGCAVLAQYERWGRDGLG